MADSQLFDVLLVDNSGNFQEYAGQSLNYSGAVALSRGVNDHRKPTQPTAVVVPAGAHDELCEAELQKQEAETALYRKGASSSDSNALDESDDSDATDDGEDAAESNVVRPFCEGIASRRAKFVQRELKRHLKRIWSAVPIVTDGADLGIIAASLEVVAKAVDGNDDDIYERFDYALHGDMRYTELEEALGVVR